MMFSKSVIGCALLLQLLLVHSSGGQEYFSSIMGLESLLKTEEILLQDIKQYIYMAKLELTTLEREFKNIIDEHKKASNDSENYLTNPVNVYRLMKRLHSDWPGYASRIRHNEVSKLFLERMSTNRVTLSFPTQDDVDGSAMALARLQETYQLDVAQVAGGILNGIKYGSAMTWEDCFALGQQLYALQEYNHTKMWLRESMDRLGREKYSSEAKSLDFMEGAAESLLHLGDLPTVLQLTEKILNLDPKRSKAADIKGHALHASVDQPLFQQNQAPSTYHDTDEFKLYEKVCRDELTVSPRQQRSLRCRYVSNNVPYRRLAPFKVEEHNLDPLVWTIHDALTVERTDMVKELAVPLLRRSTVRTKHFNVSDTSSVRISKNAWLRYADHPYTMEMLDVLNDATGLNMDGSEQLQVANYGLGGHYEPHWDFFLSNEQIGDDQGNRIATAIFYLSDVEQGGATAFPFMNVAVKPRKGNVLFWYNLHNSGDPDYRTKHAGCPVLKGSKWIGNVWIRSNAQTFARPCKLERDNAISWHYQIVK